MLFLQEVLKAVQSGSCLLNCRRLMSHQNTWWVGEVMIWYDTRGYDMLVMSH